MIETSEPSDLMIERRWACWCSIRRACDPQKSSFRIFQITLDTRDARPYTQTFATQTPTAPNLPTLPKIIYYAAGTFIRSAAIVSAGSAVSCRYSSAPSTNALSTSAILIEIFAFCANGASPLPRPSAAPPASGSRAARPGSRRR